MSAVVDPSVLVAALVDTGPHGLWAEQEDLMQLDIELFPFEPFAERIWALRRNVTSYDAWYVALAEALDLPLATLDGSLSTASGVKAKFLTPAR